MQVVEDRLLVYGSDRSSTMAILFDAIPLRMSRYVRRKRMMGLFMWTTLNAGGLYSRTKFKILDYFFLSRVRFTEY
jgi:hypothetical protein